jgi:hypothetical protein
LSSLLLALLAAGFPCCFSFFGLCINSWSSGKSSSVSSSISSVSASLRSVVFFDFEKSVSAVRIESSSPFSALPS